MSRKKTLRCQTCGYEVEMYEGRGLFQQQIIPMECSDCHTVQNIVISTPARSAVER